MGVGRPVATVVNALGPLLMAQSFDRTGGYGFGLTGMTISWVICAGAMFLARPIKAQEERSLTLGTPDKRETT